jgi:VanZ family protein
MISNKLYVGTFWAAMVAVLILSVLPISSPKFSIFSWEDKLHHFMAYGVLCFLAIKSYGTKHPLWKIGVGLVSFGLVVEIIQSTTNYRYGELMDLAANTLGILFVICVYQIYKRNFKC